MRERYASFGPTLAAEKPADLHGRAWARRRCGSGWSPTGCGARRKDRCARVFEPRPRRGCLGELVQVDGSGRNQGFDRDHWWFEDRGPPCTLLVYVDDSTGRLIELHLV